MPPEWGRHRRPSEAQEVTDDVCCRQKNGGQGVGRAVGNWLSQSKHVQEEDEDTGQDRQMSEAMMDRLLVNGGGLTD